MPDSSTKANGPYVVKCFENHSCLLRIRKWQKQVSEKVSSDFFEKNPSFVKNWFCAILYKEVRRDGGNDNNDDDNDDLNQTIFIYQEQNILLMGSFFPFTEAFLFIWSWNANNRYWKLWILEEELWFPQLWICCKREVCNLEEQQLSGTIRGSVENMLTLSWEALL